MHRVRVVRPTGRPQLRSWWSLLAAGLFVAFIALASVGAFGEQSFVLLFGALVLVAVVAWVRDIFARDEPLPPRGRRIASRFTLLQQFADGSCSAEIDASKPFEYRILRRFGPEEGLVRLYQGDQTLTFFTSDPVVSTPYARSFELSGRHAIGTCV